MDSMNPKLGPQSVPAALPHRRMLADFCSLSIKILRLANRGVSRLEFLQEVLEMLLRFCGCDAVGLRIEDPGESVSWQGFLDPSGRFAVERYPEPEAMIRFYRELFEGHFDPLSPFFTRAGSFWTADAGQPVSYTSWKDGQARLHSLEAPGHRSLLLTPFTVDGKTRGMLSLKSRRAGFFREREVEFYEGLSQTLGVAVADRRAQYALRERVKELTCLHGISQIIRQPSIPLEEVLRRSVELLPPAFQYPGLAAARILFDGLSIATARWPGEAGDRTALRAAIPVGGKQRGWIEVAYFAETPEVGENPFLPEEQHLLDGVAKQIGLLVESRQAEEDRRRMEEQLRHADRLATIGELASGVAHELNEPLGNILGFAQLARKCSGLPESAAQDLERIVQASLHAREVVKKLLIFSRQLPTRKSLISLNQVVGDGLYFLESRCHKEGIELERRLAPDLPDIVADPAQLNQVLVNLVVNSIQAMPRGGRLTVATGFDREEVSLAVEDTGVGMDERVRRQIFLPFFTTKEVGQGTGLGLSVVHGIVTAHGGIIDVWSRPGEGSRFTVRLPLLAAGAEEEGS
jgi:signal transduction histidine kinase